MAPKPASKYHALTWLIKLTRNNYQTDKLVEYQQESVDEMILVKAARKAAQLCAERARELKEFCINTYRATVAEIAPPYPWFTRLKTFNFNTDKEVTI